jgi:hypothetical protein
MPTPIWRNDKIEEVDSDDIVGGLLIWQDPAAPENDPTWRVTQVFTGTELTHFGVDSLREADKVRQALLSDSARWDEIVPPEDLQAASKYLVETMGYGRKILSRLAATDPLVLVARALAIQQHKAANSKL